MSGFRDHCDDGAPDFVTLRTKYSTARKAHICGLCGKVIEAGQKYRWDAYTEDGKFKLLKSHPHGTCVNAVEPPDPYDDLPEDLTGRPASYGEVGHVDTL
jgi:hypothetical protein